MALIRLYSLPDWKGDNVEITGEVPNLEDYDFNDKLQSFEVVEGNWQLYEHSNFRNAAGHAFGPGKVNWIESHGINRNSISSVRPV